VFSGAFHIGGKRKIIGYKNNPEVRHDEEDEA
jgi:hypothetical protein